MRADQQRDRGQHLLPPALAQHVEPARVYQPERVHRAVMVVDDEQQSLGLYRSRLRAALPGRCGPFVMLACGESNSLTGVTVGLVIAGVLCVDLSLYVCFGATPLTIIGNISKWLVWNVKGDAVPAIPYKVVFLVYVLSLGRMLLTCTAYENSLLCWQNNTKEYRGALIGGVVNSGALAVFRF